VGWATRTLTDPTGRVIIVEHDDRDTCDTWNSPQPTYNVAQVAAFTELGKLPLDLVDGTGARVVYRRGTLLVTSNVIAIAGFAQQYLCIELNILGYIGSTPIVLARTAMDSNLNTYRHSWDLPESYSAIGFEARQNVDGAASGAAVAQTLVFAVSARLWR